MDLTIAEQSVINCAAYLTGIFDVDKDDWIHLTNHMSSDESYQNMIETMENYNKFMLEQLKPEGLNVLTIHAEAEGIKCLAMFEKFIIMAKDRKASFSPLGELIIQTEDLPKGMITREVLPGREGWVAVGRIKS